MRTMKIQGLLPRDITMNSLTIIKSKKIAEKVREFYASKELEKKSVVDVLLDVLNYVEEIIPSFTDMNQAEVGQLDYDELEILMKHFMELNKSFLKILDFAGFKIQMKQEQKP